MQGRIGRRDLPRRGQHERNRMLSGAVNVGGGCIDHQNAGRGGGIHVDVVKTDTGTRNDLESGCGGNHLGVDGSGRSHQECVGVDDRLQQFRAVRAVDPADLDLISQGGDGRGGEFVGDQYNGQSHRDSLKGRD